MSNTTAFLIKRDLERKYYSDQLDNNKTDIKKIMEYHEIDNRFKKKIVFYDK